MSISLVCSMKSGVIMKTLSVVIYEYEVINEGLVYQFANHGSAFSARSGPKNTNKILLHAICFFMSLEILFVLSRVNGRSYLQV